MTAPPPPLLPLLQDEGPSTWYVVRRLSHFARPHWLAIVLSLVLLAGQVGIELLKPWPMKFIFDDILFDEAARARGLAGSTLYVLIGAASALVVIAALDGLLSFLQALFVNRAGRMIVFDVRAALFDHIQRLSLQFHSRRQTGDLLQRVTSDVRALKEVFTESLTEVLASGFYLVGMGIVLLWLDWQLALLGMLAGPVLAVLLYRNTRQIKRLSRAERRSEGALASTLHETLAAIRLVRVFNREDEARDRFREQSAESLDSGVAATMAGARFSWLVDVIRALILATILGFGVQRVLAGAMLPGELWVFFSYVRGFYRPMRTAMKQTGRITTATARAERVVELLDVKEGVADLPGARPAPRFRGEIEFRNVSFTYEAGKPVLDGIDLALPQGKVTAIVGPTGVGKTTLVSLIPRLYDPTEGAVLIDGEDIRRYTLRSVRAQMSMVLQESVLFRASIAENIAYGRHSASFDEIVAAARAANAHDFIMALPDGYETEIGERGETLSGGQRQRIAIARAMIRDAPILILDEPLVGLDGASAAAVLEALERLAAGRTAILISHQLSTVLRADHVVVLEDGRIAKQGPLRELLATDGLHRRLVTDQMTGVPEFRQVPSPRR